MQAQRRGRLESVILEELSQVIRTVKDPRVGPLTFTKVTVSPDGRYATVHFTLSTFGGEPTEDKRAAAECTEGLSSASGFLRRHLAKILSIKFIPNLTFKYDASLVYAARIETLLQQIKTSSPQ